MINPSEKITPAGSWKKNPVIYEINTLVWLGELSRALGYPVTLGNIPGDTWDGLAGLRIDAVWLMGVWERSPMGIDISNHDPAMVADFRRALPGFTPADNAGSAYCIRRYVADEAFGGDAGLAEARSQLAQRGIKLVLDFVPNHLAHDHPWVTGSPEFFIQGDRQDLTRDPVTFFPLGRHVFACGKDPYYPAWQDVVQVNAFHPGLREAMIEQVLKISGMCDGLRCDMAILVLNSVFARTWGIRAGPVPLFEYWEELIPAVKRASPGFLFIAEAYWDLEWTLQQQGFDFCYDKRLYDRLKTGPNKEILLHLAADTGFQSKLVRFIENHDEPRNTTVFGPGQNRAAAVISSTLPGARLFHEGQFEGRRVKLPVFLRKRPAETPDLSLVSFYRNLLEAISLPLLREGAWNLAECTGWSDNESYRNLMAWQWRSAGDRCLVLVNYASQSSQGRIRLQDLEQEPREWLLRDLLSNVTYQRTGHEMIQPGLFVDLGPWDFHLFRFFPLCNNDAG